MSLGEFGTDTAKISQSNEGRRAQPNTVMALAVALRSELDNLNKEIEAFHATLDPLLGEGPKKPGLAEDTTKTSSGGYSQAVNISLENWYYLQSLTERLALLRSRVEL